MTNSSYAGSRLGLSVMALRKSYERLFPIGFDY